MHRRDKGLTLVEVMIVMAIITVLMTFGVPAFLTMLPKYRLNSARDDLFTNLQLAKLNAIKENGNCGVDFFANGYAIESATNGTLKTVSLDDYGSGVTFDRPDGGAAFPGSITFNSRGLSTTSSYAYLTNEAKTNYYRVGALTSGVVRIQTYDPSKSVGERWD